MARKLQEEIHKTRPFESVEQETFLNLLRSADVLGGEMAVVLKPAGLSLTAYNVLRILRGEGEGLPCGEIGQRMITRDPDMTRLLDRLEKQHLVSRSRQQKDRRVVCTNITDAGLKLLKELDAAVMQAASQAVQAHG